jgi:hypothetical protein
MRLDQLSLALEKLQAQLAESQRLLYEVTGWSDLMRGQAMDGGETATAAAGKMKYASVRIQFQQSEFARFASELQELRAEAIVNLYDPDTIKRRSNVEQTPDRDVADQAIALLKAEFPSYRIQVRSEALAQQDFATLTAERTQFITSVGALIQGLGPSLQTMGPDGQLLLLEIVKWTAAGFRGGQSIEGVLDKFITKASKAVTAQAAAGPRQQPPDPKLAVNAQKTQGDIQKAMIEHKLELEKLAAEAATEERIQGAQARFNVAEEDAKQTIKTREEGRRQAMKPRPQGAKPRPKPQSGGV